MKACYPELEPGGSRNQLRLQRHTQRCPCGSRGSASASELGSNPEPAASARRRSRPWLSTCERVRGFGHPVLLGHVDRGGARPRERHRLSEVRSQHDQRQVPRYFCIRTSHNGRSVQLYPTDDRATKTPADGRSAAGGRGDVERPQARPLSGRALAIHVRYASAQVKPPGHPDAAVADA